MRRGDHALAARVVTPHDDGTSGAFDQLSEGAFEGGQRAVMVEVIGLDVKESEGLGMQQAERAVAFIDFEDHLAAAPMTVGADTEHLGAEQSTRITLVGGQHVDHHRGGRRLPVCPGQPDDRANLGQLSHDFGP